ncbi:MAG TPA: sigma 54-interacting transcriptional regulator [Pyrinomonadaceae bacterium]
MPITLARVGGSKMKESEDQLWQTMDTIPTLGWSARADGSAQFFNRRWLDYTGLSPDEALGWGWKVSLHPEDLPLVLEIFNEAKPNGRPFEVEARLRRADGEYRWFLFRASPRCDESGDVIQWYGINTEIEDRKRAEALLAGEKRLLEMVAAGKALRSILDALCQLVEETVRGCICGISLVKTDGTWRELAVAPSLPSSFNETTLSRPLNPDSGPCARAACLNEQVIVADIAADLQWDAFNWRSLALANGLRACWSTPIVSSENAVLGTFALYSREPGGPTPQLQNVIGRMTHLAAVAIERQRAIEKLEASYELLRRSEANLHDAQRLSHTGSWTHDLSSGRMTISPETFRIWDIQPEDDASVSEFFFGRIHPDDRPMVEEAYEEARLRKADFASDFRIILPDGTVKHIHSIGHPIPNESSEIIEFLGAVIDVTEQRRARAELESAFEEIKRLKDRIQDENVALRQELHHASMFEEIVGSSDALRKVLTQVSKAAPSDSTVLILGETGTGKELIARAIHKRSKRAERTFIAVNCGAIPTSLVASELFGHEKGAFTGATQRRLGRFEAANGGTIFLDEVGDLPPDVQIALLRVLQEREIERVGSDEPIPVDVRVLAATHRDLLRLVNEDKFRQDLLYRLNVVPIEMPSLRERATDIPLLVEYFIGKFGKKPGRSSEPSISKR